MQGFDLVNFFSGVWPFLILAFIFWWMIDRPHKKEEKKRKSFLKFVKTWKLNSCARQSALIRTLPNRKWPKSNNG